LSLFLYCDVGATKKKDNYLGNPPLLTGGVGAPKKTKLKGVNVLEEVRSSAFVDNSKKVFDSAPVENYYALIENIYFSVDILESSSDYNLFYEEFLKNKLHDLSLIVRDTDYYVKDGCEYRLGMRRYPHQFYYKDKYSIFFAKTVSDNLPVFVRVNAIYMHTHTLAECMSEIYDEVFYLLHHFSNFYPSRYNVQLSRVDICNHTTEIKQTYIKPEEYNSKVVTRLKKIHTVSTKVGQYGIKHDYYRYGSGSFAVRFYNKTREVIEMQYKQFFFEIWHQEGMIDIDTKNIYEMAFKLGKNYDLNIRYAVLMYFKPELVSSLTNIYKSKIDNSEKVEKFDALMKQFKIKKVKEITNIEFQLGNEKLKKIKLLNENGEKQDLRNVGVLFDNLELLYKHLTLHEFRVINQKDNKSRKRDKETEKKWRNVQKSKIRNITHIEKVNVSLVSEYQRKLDLYLNTKDSVQKLSRLYYTTSDVITDGIVEGLEFDDLINRLVSKDDEFASENTYHFKDMLRKQIEKNGERSQ